MYACANLSFLFKEAGPILQRYKAAAAAGFRFIESDFPGETSPEEVGKAVAENGLQQILINCFQGNSGEMGFGATPGQEEAFQSSLNRTLEYVRAAKCKKIHILSGRDFGPEKLADQIETLEKNLGWAATRLSSEEVVGVIEPINIHSKPGYFLHNFDLAVSVIEKVASPNIRLQLDLFHLQMITGNVTNNIKRLLPLTGHVQVAQSPSRHEPSFRGELNMEYVISELRKAGYVGHIGCEYVPSGFTTDCLDWISDYGLSM